MVGPRSRLAIHPGAGGDRRPVEGVNRPGILSRECDLHLPGGLRLDHPEGARLSVLAEVDAACVRPVEEDDEAERGKCFLVEPLARGVVADEDGEMIGGVHVVRIERSYYSVKSMLYTPLMKTEGSKRSC